MDGWWYDKPKTTTTKKAESHFKSVLKSRSMCICLQTTPPTSWHEGEGSAAARWACTSCLWWSQTTTTPFRAAPARWSCACALVTAVETCSRVTPRSCPSQMASRLERWWPYCSVSLFYSVSPLLVPLLSWIAADSDSVPPLLSGKSLFYGSGKVCVSLLFKIMIMVLMRQKQNKADISHQLPFMLLSVLTAVTASAMLGGLIHLYYFHS